MSGLKCRIMQTLASLVHHPLLVLPTVEGGWQCRAAMKDPHEFEPEPSPVGRLRSDLLTVAQTFAIAQDWLARRGISAHFSRAGLIDLDNKTILWTDMLAERREQPVLVLVHSEQTRRRYASELMCVEAQRLLRVCREHYRIKEPIAAVICVYGAGRVQGTILD